MSESVTGNGVVQQLNVTAGQRYYLVVDKWSPDGTTGYTVSFTGISLNCTILGLDLLSFDVEYQSDINMVDLIWVTNNENNMSHFDVERSVDGEKYELISRVKAIGNTNYETQYLAVDNDPIPGVNYYRLNMFDFDGTSKYSDIRVVNVLDDMYDILTLFPNPTTELTEVIFNSYSTEEAYMQLTDATGKIISKEGIPVVKGGNRMNMDLSAQAAGVYVLTIVTKHKTHRTKLIKE